ncbi:MAG: asparagine synthase (glutamine-hydrolyzing) [Planctomycetota bacterium]
MCGIAGFNWADRSAIEKMTAMLRHRGPDAEGYYVDSNVSFGHRRLSIIDTSARGLQPMTFENLVISYNGEIYNFRELREQLRSYGYKFVSDTDTEVVLYSYHFWGPACTNKFNGMWAFAVYDMKNNYIFLSRDRFGIKPLYYYFDGSRFIFASELKAIKVHNLDMTVSTDALNFFFYQKYIGGNLTIFKNCYKLKPSENLQFDLNQAKFSTTKYYDLGQQIARYQTVPLDERLELVEELLIDAVEKRLVSDVPIGSFLSGGVDSSLISAIISSRHDNFDTFSIGFKDKSYNELGCSAQVAEHIHTRHHYDYMQINEDLIEFIVENMDEPFGDSSVLPTYLLSKIARQKVTVSLSGDGGDEVFGGYDTYKAYEIARYVPPAVVKLSARLVSLLPASDKKVTGSLKMERFVRSFTAPPNRRHLDWMATFPDTHRQILLEDRFSNTESIINCRFGKDLLSIQLNDIQNYLAEDILKKVDLASMLNSLETRVPMLDYRLVPAVLSLPNRYKIRKLQTKWFLKQIASAYLPREIIHRPKRGFTVPLSHYVRTSHLIGEFLTNRRYFEHSMLNYNYVQQMFSDHMNRKTDNARQLWLCFVFNAWLHKNGRKFN